MTNKVDALPIATTQQCGADEPVSAGHLFGMLDGLRGIAAIMVVWYHYGWTLDWQVVPSAFLAVDFFFVLSGFVVAHAYEAQLLGGQTFGEFVRLRLVRLYPLYWLGLSIPIALLIVETSLGQLHLNRILVVTSYLFGVALLPTPHSLSALPMRVFPLNIPAWSLSLEIGINAIYAATAKYLSTGRLVTVILICGAGLIAYCLDNGTVNLGYSWSNYIGGWFRVTWSFSVGILLLRFFNQKPRRKFTLWVGAIVTSAVILVFTCRSENPAIGILSVTLVFPVAVLVGARIRIEGFVARACTWLGAISYALYITHVPILELITIVYRIGAIDPKHARPLNLILWSSFAILGAHVFTFHYDLPARRALSKYSRRD